VRRHLRHAFDTGELIEPLHEFALPKAFRFEYGEVAALKRSSIAYLLGRPCTCRSNSAALSRTTLFLAVED
jgi:hypothetical protein